MMFRFFFSFVIAGFLYRQRMMKFRKPVCGVSGESLGVREPAFVVFTQRLLSLFEGLFYKLRDKERSKESVYVSLNLIFRTPLNCGLSGTAFSSSINSFQHGVQSSSAGERKRGRFRVLFFRPRCVRSWSTAKRSRLRERRPRCR